MAKYFILGETGNDQLWLVDVENGTVAPAAGAGDAGLVKVIETARQQGLTTIKGVDVAIATNNRSDSATKSHIVDPTPVNK